MMAQIEVGFATAVTVGFGLTVTVATAELVQLVLVPVTVYDVVTVGETAIVDVVAVVLHV